jgi:porin
MGQQELFHEAGDPTEIEFRPFFGRHIVRTDVQFDAPISRQGLISWFAVAVSPLEEISPMPLYLAGGLLYRGLFTYRDNDIAGAAVYYGRASDRFPDRSDEVVIETNYTVHPTAWLYLTPDLQYVINPGGTDIPDAFVFGVEIGITF